MTKEYQIEGIRCVEFDNLYEQKEYVNKAISDNKWKVIRDLKCEYKPNFHGDTPLEKTVLAMDYGLQDYTNYFLENIENVKQESDSNTELYMDMEGFAYDMGSVVSGVPECCINGGSPTSTPTIKIFVDITFFWGVTAKEIQNRGIAITNLINTLLTRKYIIELSFVDFNIQGDLNTLIITNIDSSTLSVATIAFMSSPQFFRQISWITTDELRNRDSECGRGRSSMNKWYKQKIEEEKILFIGGSFNDEAVDEGAYRTIESANKYITKLFNKFCNK